MCRKTLYPHVCFFSYLLVNGINSIIIELGGLGTVLLWFSMLIVLNFCFGAVFTLSSRKQVHVTKTHLHPTFM